MQYNIFFQLERAYILQVLLNNQPNLESNEIFHPSQSTYSGRPALPSRYASLVLPYDWHLPGKEQRRKRKHRKSHGAISFHDLSARVVNAWKVVDDDVKAYCSQVCAIGMLRYKAAMKEWKLKGGAQKESSVQKNRRQVMKKMANLSESMPKPDVAKSTNVSTSSSNTRYMTRSNSRQNLTKKPAQITSTQRVQQVSPAPDAVHSFIRYNPRRQSLTLKKPTQDVQCKTIVQDEVLPIPAPVQSESVSIEEMDRAFENDILMGDALVDLREESMILDTWAVTPAKKQEPLILEPALATFTPANITSASTIEKALLRNPSIISNEPVDMEDNEIMSMWSQEHRYNYIPSMVASNSHVNKTNVHANQPYLVSVDYSSGGAQLPVRRRSIVASSA